MVSISNKRKKNGPTSRQTPETTKVKNRPDQCPVVGVGASAGGLEAFVSLLTNLPRDSGMAFVLLQHQDPNRPSSLVDLLKRPAAPLRVLQAQNRMRVQPNHIYVIPATYDMKIANGLLLLEPRKKVQGMHMPIDLFFRSLAEYKKEKAVGIILSGTASDGTLGLKAIKEAGGITFAQDEQSAKYFGMPHNAILADAVDFVLPPEAIAREILQLSKRINIRLEDSLEALKDNDAMSQIFELVRKSSGVDFTHYKPTTIMRRLRRRMLLHRMESLAEYLQFLRDKPKNIEALYEDILINVTSFFRDAESFEILKEEILPRLTKVTGIRSLRIWVPGCSTGEEAYSIAMALQEHQEGRGRPVSAQVFATDISERAIERARAGLYPYNISDDLSPERLRRFFVKTEQGYQIAKSIRDMCIFARHNVIKDPPFSKMDLISCRNLLIYLSPILQKKVVPLFHYALNPGGYLLLGSSESIGGFTDYFFPADKKHKIYAKKAVSNRLHFELPDPHVLERSHTASKYARQDDVVNDRDVLREGDRMILNRYAPASVIINENFDILQFRGQTSWFLEPAPGQASLNILKMAKEGVIGELRGALMKARKEKSPVFTKDLQVKVNGKAQKFSMEISPFNLPGSTQYYYLVLFENALTRRPQTRKEKSLPSGRGGLAAEAQQLRMELTATKDYLQSIIEEEEATNEELRAANEEILSSNEELQSTNEEMETAKEELQSANEELTTVNEELHVRNVELSYLNNDLSNLLASVYIPIVMLGPDLRIRRFTPMAERVLNLIPSDAGRPITDINLNIPVADLATHIQEVIDSISIKELELQDKRGHWYNLQIRPYKTTENKIDGAVLVLIDIDEIKRSLAAQRDQENFNAMLQVLHEPCVVLDDGFRIQMINSAFTSTFELTANLKDASFLDIQDGLWGTERLRSSLINLQKKGTPIENLLVTWKSSAGEKKRVRVNARKMPRLDGRALLLLAFVLS